MASTTDPRASGFDADAFRDAIRFAMNMGLPNATNERVTFKWDVVSNYTSADPSGRPYVWTDTATTRVVTDDVQIPAAVQFVARASAGEHGGPFGNIENPHVIVTILDEDYTLVQGARKIEFDGNLYIINFVAPPLGLFDVTIYQIYAAAEDES